MSRPLTIVAWGAGAALFGTATLLGALAVRTEDQQVVVPLLAAGGCLVGVLLAMAWLVGHLLRERAFFGAILETRAALVAVFDPDGRIRFANGPFRELLGEPRLARLFPAGAAWGDGGEPPPTCEATIVAPHGQRRQVLWTAAVTRDEAGARAQIVVFGFDDTSRLRTELSLFQAGRLATLGEMATGLAHELNQPITIIRLATEASIAALDAGRGDAAYLRQKLTRVAGQIGRAAAIVANMRIFGHHNPAAPQPVDPAQAIEDVLRLLQGQLQLKGIEVCSEVPPQAWPIMADLMLLEQVLINLLLNARDAILARREALPHLPYRGSITITAAAGCPGMTAITVADNGGGIPPAALPRIFDPFFTTKPPGQGTGLGLASSNGIVRDLGGRITACNGPEGAIFTVELPSASPEPVDA